MRKDRLNIFKRYIQMTMVYENAACQKKKTAICWLCLTALLSLWALCTHARLNALWKSGLTPRLINVNIPQQTAHRWGLIYEHKLPVRVSLYFISCFVNGMSLVMELQSQIPAGTPSPPGCVESEGQRIIWAFKLQIICCKNLKQCNCSVSQLSFIFKNRQNMQNSKNVKKFD